jgi:hypothetical protein
MAMKNKKAVGLYKDALRWLVDNDDNSWIKDGQPMNVTGALVCDLFDVEETEFRTDMIKTIEEERVP